MTQRRENGWLRSRFSVLRLGLTAGVLLLVSLGGYSVLGQAEPTPMPPSAPTVNAVGESGRIELELGAATANGSPITGYEYRIKENKQPASHWIEWTEFTFPAGGEVFNLPDLENCISYDVEVRANSAAGYSDMGSDTAFPLHRPVVSDVQYFQIGNDVHFFWDVEGGVPLTQTQVTVRVGDTEEISQVNLDPPTQTSYSFTPTGSGDLVITLGLANQCSSLFNISETTHTRKASETVPGRPENVRVTHRNQTSYNLTWDPVEDNGNTITAIEIRFRNTGQTSWNTWQPQPSSPGTPISNTRTVTLGGDLSRDHQVRAAFGPEGGRVYGPISRAVSSGKAIPSEPSIRVVNSHHQAVQLIWDPIENNRSNLVRTEFRYKPSSSGNSAWSGWLRAHLTNPSATTATATGLTNGTAYDFELRGVNERGRGHKATTTGTPQAGTASNVPSAPTVITNTPGSGQLSFVLDPGIDNGSPITSTEYRIKETKQTASRWSEWTEFTFPASRRNMFTVPELENCIAYDVEFRANNVNGAGATAPATATPVHIPEITDVQYFQNGSESQFFWDVIEADRPLTQTQVFVMVGDNVEVATRDLEPPTQTSFSFTPTGTGNLDFRLAVANECSGLSPVSVNPFTRKASEAIPGRPENLRVRRTNNQIAWSWDVVGDNGNAVTDVRWRRRSNLGTWGGWTSSLQMTTEGPVLSTGASFSTTNTTTWEFQVQAFNNTVAGPVSRTLRTGVAVPNQPPNLSATGYHQSIQLSWDSIDHVQAGLDSSEYRYKPTDMGHTAWSGWALADPDNATVKSTTVTGLTNGTSYDFEVRGASDRGRGHKATATGTPRATPDSPANLTAVAYHQEVVASWDPITDNGNTVTSTEYRTKETSATSWSVWAEVDEANATATELELTGLTNDTSYDIQVRAQNSEGPGPAALVMTTPVATPSPPGNLTTTSRHLELQLNWDAVADNGNTVTSTEYRHKRTSQDHTGWSAWTEADSGNALARTVLVTSLVANTSYDLEVRSTNSAGPGRPSRVTASTLMGPPPSAPPFILAGPTHQAVVLYWDPIPSDSPLTSTQYRYKQTSQADSFYSNWANVDSSNPMASMVTVSGLTNGTEYTFQLRGVNSIGPGDATPITATPAANPAQPQNLMATATNLQITVLWDPIGDHGNAIEATEFRYKQTAQPRASYTDWTAVDTSNPTAISRVITGLSPSTSYDIQVRARNSVGNGPFNQITISTAAGPVPARLLNLMAYPTNQAMVLVWDQIANGSITNTLYRYKETSQGNAGWSDWDTVDDTNPRATTVLVENLTNNRSYDFQVLAANNFGQGEPANITATPLPSPGQPAVTILGAHQKIILTWDTIPGHGSPLTATQYRYKESSAHRSQWSDWTVIDDTDGIPTTFTLSPLTNGVPYDVQLRAENAQGYGPPSTVISATPSAVPDQPQNLEANPANQSVYLVWDPIVFNGHPPHTTLYRHKQSSQDDTQWSEWTSVGIQADMDNFLLTGLTNNIEYDLELRGDNQTGPGQSAAVSFTPRPTPEQPQNVEVYGQPRGLHLFFDPIDDFGSAIIATQYRYKKTAEDRSQWTEWTNGTVTSSTGQTDSLVISPLDRHHSYDIEIRARNSVGDGPPVRVTAITSLAPSSPQNLTGQPAFQSAIISWDEIEDFEYPLTATQYRYKKTTEDNSAWVGWHDIVPVGYVPHRKNPRFDPHPTSFGLLQIENGHSYDIQIRGKNERGAGVPATLTVTLGSNPSTYPNQPEEFRIHNIKAEKRPRFYWDHQTTDGFGANSEPLTDMEFRFKPVWEDDSQFSSWFSANVNSGTLWWGFWAGLASHSASAQLTTGYTYEFQLRRVNQNGPGPSASYEIAYDIYIPDFPSGVSYTSGEPSTFTWDPIDDGNIPLTYLRYKVVVLDGNQLETLVDFTDLDISATSVDVPGIAGRPVTFYLQPCNPVSRFCTIFNMGAQKKFAATAMPRIPRQPDLRISHRALDSFTIAWDAYGSDYQPLTLEYFLWRVDSDRNPRGEPLTNTWQAVDDPLGDYQIIEGLDARQEYQVQLRATNQNGQSESLIIPAYTDPTDNFIPNGSLPPTTTPSTTPSPTTPPVTQPPTTPPTMPPVTQPPTTPPTQPPVTQPPTSPPTQPPVTQPPPPSSEPTTPTTPTTPPTTPSTQPPTSPPTQPPGTTPPNTQLPGPSVGQPPVPPNGVGQDPTPPTGVSFTDIAGNVHEANIIQLAGLGITRGCNPPSNTRYCPDRAVTRAEMATFMVRAFSLSTTDDSPFQDTGGNVHRSNINNLAAAGISRGCNPPSNTRYCPDRAVTRAEMATFITRALSLTEQAGDFTDTAESVHVTNIQRLAAAGITRGCNPPSNTRFCPERAVTRAEMATFLIRSTAIANQS